MGKKSRREELIRTLLLVGGVLIISTISPAGGAAVVRILIKNYIHKRRFERKKFLRDIWNLQRKDVLEYQQVGAGRVKIVLTQYGKKKALLYDLDNIKFETGKKWDRKWRLVMFDIPHSLKKARDAFRKKLTALGFYGLQKSVFITPYPCENEIDFICSVFEIRRYVLILSVSRFEGEEKLKYRFRLD